MILKYLEPILAPFRELRNRIVGVKTTKGNIVAEAKYVRTLGKASKKELADAKQQAGAVRGKVQSARGRAAGMAGKGQTSQGVMIVKGAWFWKKAVCPTCGTGYPPQISVCSACAAPSKTQAFAVDVAGGGGTTQLLGWVVPLQGPQRGELFALSPKTLVGTDPECDVVLQDKFMSAQHAEIKVEGGAWIVADLGSTNGTYVNDKRVDRQELIDNDFVKFGSSLVKFKTL